MLGLLLSVVKILDDTQTRRRISTVLIVCCSIVLAFSLGSRHRPNSAGDSAARQSPRNSLGTTAACGAVGHVFVTMPPHTKRANDGSFAPRLAANPNCIPPRAWRGAGRAFLPSGRPRGPGRRSGALV